MFFTQSVYLQFEYFFSFFIFTGIFNYRLGGDFSLLLVCWQIVVCIVDAVVIGDDVVITITCDEANSNFGAMIIFSAGFDSKQPPFNGLNEAVIPNTPTKLKIFSKYR